jgi:hypothetical protein
MAGLLVAGLLAGGSGSTPSFSTGPNPRISPPYTGIFPSLHFATHEAWPNGKTPQAPKGFAVTRYAGIDHPRWLYVLPNGDVLVAQSSTIKTPSRSMEDRIHYFLERHTGVIRPSPNKITLLRDSNRDGKVDHVSAFLDRDLDRPFGMLVLDGKFYVADTGSVRVYPYRDGQTHIAGKGKKILSLPVGGYNNHWTRNLCHGRLRQQCRRTRHGERETSREHSGDEPGWFGPARVCVGHSQSERAGLRTAKRAVVDGVERARFPGRRSGPGFPDARARRRFLRLAVVVLGPACR